MKRTCLSLAILIALCALTASAAWAGDAKVTICHVPPGNPDNAHTISVSPNAVPAHLAHGDYLGECIKQCPPGFTGPNCDIDIDECASSPCVNGDCTDHVNGYSCTCPPGWTGTNCDIPIPPI
ncbi:MAG: calcium-binding EGF-like domain-containing protein [Thermoanaerobaculia bacterium]